MRGIVQKMSHLTTTWASRKTAPLSRVRETESLPSSKKERKPGRGKMGRGAREEKPAAMRRVGMETRHGTVKVSKGENRGKIG